MVMIDIDDDDDDDDDDCSCLVIQFCLRTYIDKLPHICHWFARRLAGRLSLFAHALTHPLV